MPLEDSVTSTVTEMLKKPDTLPAEFKSWLVKLLGDEGKTTIVSAGFAGSSLPVGTPLWLLGLSSPPSGTLALDGSAINATTHPLLATLFGANLPDMRGRAPFGVNSSVTEINTERKNDGVAVGTRGPTHNHDFTPVGTVDAHHHVYKKPNGATASVDAGTNVIKVADLADTDSSDTAPAFTGTLGTTSGTGPKDHPGFMAGLWVVIAG